MPIAAITDGPNVQWNHIDGPLLTWAGELHWLTWRERFSLLFRRSTIDAIASARFPHLARLRRSLITKAEPL